VQDLLAEGKRLLLEAVPLQRLAAETNRVTSPLRIIGLISDTHIPSRARTIPPRVFEVFRDASLILHAGDLTQLSVLTELERLAPVVAVQGNMDDKDVVERLSKATSVKVEGWRVGLTHSLGVFAGLRRMRKTIKPDNFNALVFGHTHRPVVKWKANVLFINPGSPTNPMPPFFIKPTIGLLRVSREKIEPEIIRI